jgi:uracil phosphoribosyltransferase
MPVHRVHHPIVEDALLSLRDRSTGSSQFRQLTRRVSLVLAVEATQTLPTDPADVETPLEQARGQILAGPVVLVPILRAGLAMVDAILDLLPQARVGHIGLQRDEVTAEASQYYAKLPADLDTGTVVLADPSLATGGSAIAAIALLRAAGARDLRLLSIVAAPEGIEAVERADPDVQMFVAAIDRGLSATKFILPGLGDFGDRLYGTVP